MSESLTESLFAEGVELFNHGCFFEAHEKWEEIWKGANGREKALYQGLIQAAAALHHARRGNRRGATAVYVKAKPKLEETPDAWKNLQIATLRRDLARYFEGENDSESEGEPPRLISIAVASSHS